MSLTSFPLPPPSSSLHDLTDDLLHLILSVVPIRSAVTASSVCKHWQSVVSSSHFANRHSLHSFHRKPWFFLYGINDFIPTKSQAFAFDPEAGRWVRLPWSSPPPHNHASLAGMNGLLFGLMGVKQSKLCYTPSALKPKWKVTAPMEYSRYAPLVGIIGNPNSPSYKLIVAGGAEDEADRSAVEMYDAAADRWELCPCLPVEFGENYPARRMSSAVYRGKFYVSDMHSGNVSAFDLEKRNWSPVRCIKPHGVIYSFLVACDSSLIMAGLCNAGEGACLKLWHVDETTMVCKEISSMPPQLFALFEDGDDKHIALKCTGGGNIIYVYSDSKFKDYLTCVCDLTANGCSWARLPSLPAPVNRFDNVACFSSNVPVDACFPC